VGGVEVEESVENEYRGNLVVESRDLEDRKGYNEN
jgi:hypothetical protein